VNRAQSRESGARAARVRVTVRGARRAARVSVGGSASVGVSSASASASASASEDYGGLARGGGGGDDGGLAQ
jgi:hypothetical protein